VQRAGGGCGIGASGDLRRVELEHVAVGFFGGHLLEGAQHWPQVRRREEVGHGFAVGHYMFYNKVMVNVECGPVVEVLLALDDLHRRVDALGQPLNRLVAQHDGLWVEGAGQVDVVDPVVQRPIAGDDQRDESGGG
jgi:hypothetical protein